VVEDALRTELDDKRDIILECDTTFAAKVEQFKALEGEHAQLLNGGAAKKGFEDARDDIQNMSARMDQMQLQIEDFEKDRESLIETYFYNFTTYKAAMLNEREQYQPFVSVGISHPKPLHGNVQTQQHAT
jgi:hypothetical protein